MTDAKPFNWREAGHGHIGRLLMRALRQVQASSLARLQQTGHPDVRTGHIPVFSNVDPDGTRITELASRAGMTRQMMGRLVRELEEIGYASSEPDPSDQRAVIVTLTGRGWRFCHDARRTIAEQEREIGEMLGDGELTRLKAALVRLAEARDVAADRGAGRRRSPRARS